jgi:NADH-quinone oxidoreductase subunit C
LKAEPELEFVILSDICSLDWLGDVEEKEGRFEVIYNLYSLKSKYRLLLKVRLAESDPTIDTVTTIWQGANWMEREVFDLMGITFVGHPDLRKIVTPDELEGYPLRKDYPLTYEMPQFSYNKNEPPEVIL